MRLHAIRDATATETSGAQPVGPVCAAQVSGIVAGDEVTIEESIDGENWETVGSVITADGITALTINGALFRAAVTAVAGGGTINVWLSNGIEGEVGF